MSKFSVAYIKNAESGIVEVKPRKNKIAIIAGGPTKIKVPFDDPDWEVWGLNEMSQKRAERYFEMHPLDVQSQYELTWLKNCKKPVYLLELDEELVPYGVRYPIERVLSVKGARDYFTSTFAYQVALAISEGFEEIGLWGLPLFIGSPREQTIERMCLEWWLGLAEGKGIKITTDPLDKLLYHPHRYGYDYYEEKRYVEGIMSFLGRQISFYQRHLIPDAGKYVSLSEEEYDF